MVYCHSNSHLHTTNTPGYNPNYQPCTTIITKKSIWIINTGPLYSDFKMHYLHFYSLMSTKVKGEWQKTWFPVHIQQQSCKITRKVKMFKRAKMWLPALKNYIVSTPNNHSDQIRIRCGPTISAEIKYIIDGDIFTTDVVIMWHPNSVTKMLKKVFVQKISRKSNFVWSPKNCIRIPSLTKKVWVGLAFHHYGM
jgi:hypothetical protein